MLPLLHDLSDDARAIGAVNTIVLSNARRVGHNTDWWGFAESFRRGLHDAQKNSVVQLGAGRAVAGSDLTATMATADGLIHATPTGMVKYPGLPLPAELLRPALWVAEIVYFPLQTELLRVARRLGCRTMNGSGMAVFQAVEAIRLFTGITPDAERMQRDFASMGG